MTERDGSRGELLPHIRRLQAERDHHSVVEALEGVSRERILSEPALGYALAVAYQALGRTDDARALTLALREPCARRGRDRLYRQRLNLEAALEFGHGRLDRAEELWSEVLGEATGADDHELVAKASNNLGILHTLAGRSSEALAAYSRALLANQRLGDRRGLAQAHQNLAITFREAGFDREADAHFGSAAAHAEAADGEDVLGRAEEERALLFLLRGDPGMAEVSARRALTRLTEIGDAAGEAEALRVLGLTALARDRLQEAHERLQSALDRGRALGARLLEAETLTALAAVARRRGDERTAAELTEDARGVFRAIGAEAWGERARRQVEQVTGPFPT